MALTVNKHAVLGNLGGDPETSFTQNNVKKTKFNLATTRSYKGKDDKWVNETEWHILIGFNVSDYVLENLSKGDRMYAEGRVVTRWWTEDGSTEKNYITETILDSRSIIPLGKAGSVSPSSQSEEAPPSSEDDDLPF